MVLKHYLTFFEGSNLTFVSRKRSLFLISKYYAHMKEIKYLPENSLSHNFGLIIGFDIFSINVIN